MACTPTTCRCGRCEERILNAFVAVYNDRNGTRFRFQKRLDATGPDPQPEALYQDERNGDQLVIERKSLIWPRDFAKMHASLHTITEIVERETTSILDPLRAYRLRLPEVIRGKRDEIHNFAKGIAGAIARGIDSVHRGSSLRSTQVGREWSFRLESADEREYFQPSTGLGFVFSCSSGELDWGVVTEEFAAEFQRLLRSTEGKFANYQTNKRFMLIDPYGDVRWSTDDSWRTLFSRVTVPANIEEVWVSMHEKISDVECGWIQRRLWPTILGDDYAFCSQIHGASNPTAEPTS